MTKYIFIFILSFNLYSQKSLSFEQGLKRSELMSLSQNIRWTRLLQYRSPFIGKSHSIIDNKNFFFSKDGDENPFNELTETIKAFQKTTYNKKAFKWHPQCAFPARLKFIKKNTGLKFPPQKCTDFLWWKNRINAKSLSLVFSSYYKGNPSSIFGHTLLKFNTDKEGGKLSDFTFNFAADVGPDKGITYIINGLTGGYHGVFSTDPYYVKINDYVQGESRDVWEYLLKLNDDEVDWVLKHIWELKTNGILDYYFLDENCSFIILAILDVARLDWNTSRGFHFYTLPVTTVKRVNEVNGFSSVFYRPSFRKKMMARLGFLNIEQRNKYFDLINNKNYLKKIKDKRVLEAYIAYLRFRQYEEGDNGNDIKAIRKDIRRALIKRARVGGKTKTIDDQIKVKNIHDDPIKSHKTYTMKLNIGSHNFYKNYVDYKFRFGIHDMMNNGLGLPRFSNIEVLSLKSRYLLESKKLNIEEVVFIDLLTLINFDKLTKEKSWGVRVSIEKQDDFISDKLFFKLRPVYGVSKYLLNDLFSLFALATFDVEMGSFDNGQNYRIGPGLSLGIIGYFTDKLKSRLTFDYGNDLLGKYISKSRLSCSYDLSYSFNSSFELNTSFKLNSSSDKLKTNYSDIKFQSIYFF